MTQVLGWLLEGTAITLLSVCAIALVPQSLPALRHRLWWLTLAIVLALPVFDLGLGVTVAGDALPAGPVLTSESLIGVAVSAPSSWLTLPEPPGWLSAALAAVWCLIAGVGLARLARQVAAARRLVIAASPVAERRMASWTAFSTARASGRRVQVASANIPGACAIGGRTPCIVLGRRLVHQLDACEIETIVLHEYAHLLRYDDLTQLLQRVIVALVGFHPCVRWISRRIDAEREAACDQLASYHIGSAFTCARALARAAEVSLKQPQMALRLAPGASLSDGGLQKRVNRLLSDRTVRPWIASSVALLEAAVILTAGAAVFQTHPVVDFRTSPESLATAPQSFGDGAAAVEPRPSNREGIGTLREPGDPFGQMSNATVAVRANQPPSADADEQLLSSGAAARPATLPVSQNVTVARVGTPAALEIERLSPAPFGAIVAQPDYVAVRGAEHTEHTATLALSVSSVASSHPSQPAGALAARILSSTGSAIPAILRLEASSFSASETGPWSQASQAGADMGRSAAAAGHAIGRFFQRQGRAVARRF